MFSSFSENFCPSLIFREREREIIKTLLYNIIYSIMQIETNLGITFNVYFERKKIAAFFKSKKQNY